MTKKFLISVAFSILCFALPSCSAFSDDCANLRSEISDSEFSGQILFREYELQLNRFTTEGSTPSRLNEATVALLENYAEIHKLILEKPQCLADSNLETILKQGLPVILSKIEKAKLGNKQAADVMRGELGESYQSMNLWLKD